MCMMLISEFYNQRVLILSGVLNSVFVYRASSHNKTIEVGELGCVIGVRSGRIGCALHLVVLAFISDTILQSYEDVDRFLLRASFCFFYLK